MINMNNINLNSPEWCELIFNGKNKDYGAYELRKNSSGRHIGGNTKDKNTIVIYT